MVSLSKEILEGVGVGDLPYILFKVECNDPDPPLADTVGVGDLPYILFKVECNDPDPPLADTVLFGLPLKSLKYCPL